MIDNEITFLNNRQIQPYSVIKGLITEFNFVNLGTIKKIHNEHYIDVLTYTKNGDGTDNVITDVRLLQLGTTKCKLFVQPAIGDNVIVLTPKDFVPKLIYNNKPKEAEAGYMPYGNINACAILIREESDDNVKTTVNIDENGNITVKTDGDATVNAKKDCSVTAENILVKANTKTEIKGAKVIIGGTVIPNGTGALCGMPYCAFSGAPQTGDTSNNA